MGGLARQLRFVFLGTVLVVAAFSTGINFLFFLVYLLGALLLAAWFFARRGLQGLRAGYYVVNPRAQVGDVLQAIYRVDNDTRWGKPWVELWNESTLPAPLPGRVIGVKAGASRQWLAKVTLLRRGSFRLGALRVRTGDPFGLFTTEMVVGQPTWIVVFPKVHTLPHWRLPPSPVDGTQPSRRRWEAASPLVRSIRPYVHGDAINRIHWLSSVRHNELQVKEFDLEQTADLWIVLDLERSAHAGTGDSSSVEAAVTAAASIAVQTLAENRAVGLTVSSRRQHVLTPDRGTRVEQKVLHLLANVQADGTRPLAEVLLGTMPQLRRGMSLCLITGSTDREWARALASLRRRGVATVVVLLDRFAFAAAGRVAETGPEDAPDAGQDGAPDEPEGRAEVSAMRHALAEYDIGFYPVGPADDLGEALGGRERVRA
jgi:uncharacterized protein (DUF58 family)